MSILKKCGTLFVLFSVFFLVTSCEKNVTEIAETQNQKENLRIQVLGETTDFTAFRGEILTFWEKGLEEYSLETFCSCNCDGVSAAQKLLNDNYDLLPSIFETYEPTDYSCLKMKKFMSQDCRFPDNIEFKGYIKNIEPSEFFTREELDLVFAILEDVENNKIKDNNSVHREEWKNLKSVSKIDNAGSALILEFAASAEVFVPAFQFDNDEDRINALWNKVGGAFVGAALSLTYDSFQAGSGSISGSEAWSSVKKGALLGAVRSL